LFLVDQHARCNIYMYTVTFFLYFSGVGRQPARRPPIWPSWRPPETRRYKEDDGGGGDTEEEGPERQGKWIGENWVADSRRTGFLSMGILIIFKSY
jgi:hypothetical protein